ncbi:MAG: TrmH family RNA methyltransferase, partial [Pirellulales bacterium]
RDEPYVTAAGRAQERERLPPPITVSRSSANAGRARYRTKTVLVLGSEGKGVSPPIARVATALMCIPGTGAVESLNVSVAAGVLLAEAWRQRH